MLRGPLALALDIADRTFDGWLTEPERHTALLRHTSGGVAAIREQMQARVRDVLAQELPWAANRRWACETIRAWAPLAALLDPPSSDLELHRALLVEFEYGHLIAETRSIERACEMLRVDLERLALEIDIATDLTDLLERGGDNASGWVRDYRAMSLLLADYLHRCTADLPPNLPDALAHHYATEIARMQREIRDECLSARQLPKLVYAAGVAVGA